MLPFANMSRDPDDEYFSDGLAEEIINLLAHVPDLKVTARTSSFAFRGKEQDIRRIAEALGVRTILEGSVRRAGSRIRVTAQLINAEDGYHLWSERYDRELTDVFAIQDEIAQAIADALATEAHLEPRQAHARLSGVRSVAQGAASRENLRAGGARPRQGILRAGDRARSEVCRASRACSGLSPSFRRRTRAGPCRRSRLSIRREARRALELDPFDTDPHFLLGAVAAANDYNWPEAAREFQLAMASPSVPAEAHWAYASLYLCTFGRFEESTAEMRRAVEQDPLSVHWRGVLMGHLVCAGRYEEALEEGFKALDIADNEIHPHLALSEAYLGLGEVTEAVASAERAHRNLPQQSMATGLLAALLVRIGERGRAETLLAEMGSSPTPIWGRAWYHLLCSEIDAAAVWYEKMIEAREIFAPVYANSLYTAELRASPYWPKLARMMKLSDSAP